LLVKKAFRDTTILLTYFGNHCCFIVLVWGQINMSKEKMNTIVSDIIYYSFEMHNGAYII